MFSWYASQKSGQTRENKKWRLLNFSMKTPKRVEAVVRHARLAAASRKSRQTTEPAALHRNDHTRKKRGVCLQLSAILGIGRRQ